MPTPWTKQVAELRHDTEDSGRLQTYLLVDPAATHDLGVRLPPHDEQLCCSIVDEERIATAGIKPFVVWLEGDEAHAQRLLDAWGRHCAQANCLSVLRSRANLWPLANALRKRTGITLAGGLSAVLRIADTRIMPAVWPLLTLPQQLCLGQEIAQWACTDRDGQLQLLNWPAPGAREQLAPDTSIRLTQHQEDAMLAASQADRVMPELGHDFMTLTERWSGHRRWQWVSEAVEQARKAGVEGLLDLIVHCDEMAQRARGVSR
ncbi:hypothetical protein BH11PSE9_BH11PSE9_09570 [soil metagenome]